MSKCHHGLHIRRDVCRVRSSPRNRPAACASRASPWVGDGFHGNLFHPQRVPEPRGSCRTQTGVRRSQDTTMPRWRRQPDSPALTAKNPLERQGYPRYNNLRRTFNRPYNQSWIVSILSNPADCRPILVTPQKKSGGAAITGQIRRRKLVACFYSSQGELIFLVMKKTTVLHQTAAAFIGFKLNVDFFVVIH